MGDDDLNRWPADPIAAVEHLWPYFLAAWLLGVVAALLVARFLGKRYVDRAVPYVAFATLVSLIPSVRDWVLPASTVGLAAGWLALSLLGARISGRVNEWLSARWAWVTRLSTTTFAIGGALFCFAFYLLVGFLEFGWVPVLQDTQDQLFHAHVLRGGAAYAVTPPFGEFYLAELMVQDSGRWYSPYPLGHIVPLTIGVFFGAPWAVNPLLGAFAGWLVYRTTAHRFGESRGRLAWLLFVASPFTMVMSAEYMNHASAGVAFMLQLLALSRFVPRESSKAPGRALDALLWGAVYGFGAGWLTATRPLTSLVIVGVVALFAIYLLRKRLVGLRRLVPFLIGAGLFGMLWMVPQLLFNAATTGDPFRFGYEVLFPHLGWGFIDTQRGLHTPFRAVEFFFRFLNEENLYLLGLPLPGVLVVMVGIYAGPRDWWRWLIAAVYLAMVLVYSGYFFSDVTFGPRYTYEASLALFGLAAVGLPTLVERVDAWLTRIMKRPVSSLPALILLYLVSFTPNQMLFYHRAYAVNDGVVALAERTLSGPSLVFVEGSYRRAFFAVRPSLEQEVLFARDRGENNHLLACHEEGRAAYVERDGALIPFNPECEP